MNILFSTLLEILLFSYLGHFWLIGPIIDFVIPLFASNSKCTHVSLHLLYLWGTIYKVYMANSAISVEAMFYWPLKMGYFSNVPLSEAN
jgi:hypothetical protein